MACLLLEELGGATRFVDGLANMVAAFDDNVVQRRLVESGWNIGAIVNGEMFMSQAILDQALVCMALSNGQTASAESSWLNGWTALHWAAFYDRADCLAELMRKVPSLLYQQSDEHRLHALHCAAENNSLDVLEPLIIAGADPNVQDCAGDTAAHKSARRGHVEFIRRLLSYGCDLSTVNMAGLTATDVAQLEGHVDCTTYLQQAARLQRCNLYPPFRNANGQLTQCDNQSDSDPRPPFGDALMDVQQDMGETDNALSYCVTGAYGFTPLYKVDASHVKNGDGARSVAQVRCVKRASADEGEAFAFKRSKLLG